MKTLNKCLVLAVLCLTSCRYGDNDLFPDLYKTSGFVGTLKAYNDLKTGSIQLPKGAPAMYVDFSAGMYTAFGTPAIRELMAHCFNTLLDSKLEVYKLVQGMVTPIAVSNSTQLGQLVNDPKQYLDRRAPIQAAVEKIVNSGNDALLVTDFEEWQDDKEVTATAYLKIAFSKWINAGNSITFYIADYREGNVDKHIYFTVFTKGRASGESLIDRLSSAMTVLPNRFTLSANPYAIRTDYPNASIGGIFQDKMAQSEKQKNVLDVQSDYINGSLNDQAFEYYPLGVDWQTIEQVKADYGDTFHELFRKLYIDLSEADSYTKPVLDVKTYAVREDFERYARSIEVTKHRPHIIKGNDGENKIAEGEQDPVALTCYEPDGTVKASFRYHPDDRPALGGMFILNTALLKNTQATDIKNTEIGVAFAPAFKAAHIPDPKGLIRIDLVVREVTPNTGNPVLSKFKWVNAEGVINSALFESVKSALEDARPHNRTIYTYYIKTTEQ
ncbi:hypothetical protein LLH06_10780 [Mucilaginibacter daejeonensis]|uniref:hypothetical protein n=1 Tax=Mucilaginibacter daejeonensis TaxID=398049 RepID=UPI001D17AE84|nr:hypothetical protein [Mucilaginibacter daejeonensis]UEG51458.1 hypothetical protein LLH06_10780 [Mucilaginibacter daejeonensis]